TAGDPDVSSSGFQFTEAEPTGALMERLTPKPFDTGEDPGDRRLHHYLPEPIHKQWHDYYDRFVTLYKLDEETRRDQKAQAEGKFLEEENAMVQWLTEGVKKVKRKGLSGPDSEVALSTPKRVDEYLASVAEVKKIEGEEKVFFGLGTSARLRTAKDTEAKFRKELQDDLDAKYTDLKKSLREVLTSEQKRMDLPADPPVDDRTWSNLAWIDNSVRWGLAIVGACLLVGLFTRAACLAGSAYLLLFYLAMPALPGLAENPAAPGHYLIINNNIIEILALMAIATSRPGQRYGLDALLRAAWPWRRSDEVDARRANPPPASGNETFGRLPRHVETGASRSRDVN
ncbi:MAG TPA: DoxX family protein, partial [Gemmataceae bacterium]